VGEHCPRKIAFAQIASQRSRSPAACLLREAEPHASYILCVPALDARRLDDSPVRNLGHRRETLRTVIDDFVEGAGHDRFEGRIKDFEGLSSRLAELVVLLQRAVPCAFG